MKWATVVCDTNHLSPACAGSNISLCFEPGAHAPGFMLAPASQAKEIRKSVKSV